MATYYNEEHEAIISTEVEAIVTAKEGEIVPHKQNSRLNRGINCHRTQRVSKTSF